MTFEFVCNVCGQEITGTCSAEGGTIVFQEVADAVMAHATICPELFCGSAEDTDDDSRERWLEYVRQRERWANKCRELRQALEGR
jgi:hypothetical protein